MFSQKLFHFSIREPMDPVPTSKQHKKHDGIRWKVFELKTL